MKTRDQAAQANERRWNELVVEGCGYCIPWLALDIAALKRYAAGELATFTFPEDMILPQVVLADVAGKDVLCLGAGGGQQSAVFGVLDAHVTVVDLAQGQLDGDQAAADHYGYKVTLVHGDMRDLSALADDSFDLVYGTGMSYVPDVAPVYAEVARVLRPGGLYRVDFGNPALHMLGWDGQRYYLTIPYAQKLVVRDDGAHDYRHHMSDIFDGLLTGGFAIERLWEDVSYLTEAPDAEPGTWDHERMYAAGGFVILARRVAH